MMLARRLQSVAPGDANAASREDSRGSEGALAGLVSALDGSLGPLAIVRTEIPAVLAVAEHAARWLDQAGASAVVVQSGRSLEPWREATRKIAALHADKPTLKVAHVSGKRAASASARCLAEELASELVRAPHLSLVVADVDSTSRAFATTVVTELDALLRESADTATAELGSPAFSRVVWIVGPEAVLPELASATWTRSVVEVSAELDALDAREWWRLAAACATPAATRLDALERWWRKAQSIEVDGSTEVGARIALLPSHAVHVLAVLALAGRALHPIDIAEVLRTHETEVSAVVVLLRDAGFVACAQRSTEPGFVALSEPLTRDDLQSSAHAGRPTIDLASIGRDVAALLARLSPDDPWALVRAAELVLAARDATGDARSSRESFRRAIRLAVDSDARADLWERFMGALEADSASAATLVDLSELALRTGDADIALRLARGAASAVSRGAPDHGAEEAAPSKEAVLLVLGRALVATGDLVAGVVTLEQATRVASTHAPRARAWVELAEARYWSSDLAGAREAADTALTLDAPAAERLDARNVLGKLLLARGDYAAAEVHFATDACDAAIASLPVAELRARVNRAISVLSLGRRREAQSLLESVLGDAEARGELKAAGLTLVNLAPIAILDHRYGDALEISERAVGVLRRIGDRLALAKCIANLADLRVRMGLVDEAGQALKFGARVFKGAPPREQAAHFAIVTGRTHLAKHDTVGANAAVVSALASLGVTSLSTLGASQSEVSGPAHELVSQALRLGVRVALEDGDLARAKLMLTRAESERAPVRAKAEIAVLRAMLARAEGEPFEALARAALTVCRESDEDELLREAHVLAYRAAADDASWALASENLDAAAYYRDRVAEGLPTALRARYFEKLDVATVDRELAFIREAARAGRTQPGDDGDDLMTSRPSAPPSFVSVPPSIASIPSAQASRSASRARRIVGSDLGIRTLLNAVAKVAPSEAIILIHGESGTGKELVAEAIHAASQRKSGPLVKVNCAALVETLLLSELFGHEKGAFTGAASKRRGRFEAADGGTLFLDEIGDISPRTQVALLRVLQEKTFERVGGTTSVRANVRVICATHRDLKALVARGEFREDLYYRLCGVTLTVPALRARLGDIGPIADTILDRVAEERGGSVKRLSARALTALKSHTWPGNVRELENALRAASLFAEGAQLEPEDFADNVESLRHIAAVPSPSIEPPPGAVTMRGLAAHAPATLRGTSLASEPGMTSQPSIFEPSNQDADWADGTRSSLGLAGASASTPSDVAYAQVRAGTSLHDMKRIIERECIARALLDASGNITRAATLLGMKRPRLSQLVKQYGLGADSDLDAGCEAGSDDGADGSAEDVG